MKRNKTRSINIQALAFISHCGGRERLHKASGVRGVLLIANCELRIANCELRIGNDQWLNNSLSDTCWHPENYRIVRDLSAPSIQSTHEFL